MRSVETTVALDLVLPPSRMLAEVFPTVTAEPCPPDEPLLGTAVCVIRDLQFK